MLDSGTLQKRIGTMIRDSTNVDGLSVDTDLFETGVLDSLAFVELLMHLERAFGIRISIEEVEIDRFCSIARIAEFVTARMSLEDSRRREHGTWSVGSASGGRGADGRLD